MEKRERRKVDIELFGCSGGMAEGFKRAGICFDMVFDLNPDCCDSYSINLGERPIQMDVSNILVMLQLGWRPPSIRLLVADPPCTPWSRAGKRMGLDDPRDMLSETVEIIRLSRPDFWLIANVPGLDDGSNLAVVRNTIGSLFDDGYCIDYRKLNAADYGVPQRRIRPFWFGHRKGTTCISWPVPTHGDPGIIGHKEFGDCREPWVTCRDALQHLPVGELGIPRRLKMNLNDRKKSSVPQLTVNEKYMPNVLDEPSGTIRTSGGSCRSRVLSLHQKYPISKPDEPSLSITAKDHGACAGGAVEWPWDRVSTTVFCDERIAPPGSHPGPNANSLPNAVVLSERAAAILQGFPEDWKFCGKSKKARWAQIGQAMPPPLAYAVANKIKVLMNG